MPIQTITWEDYEIEEKVIQELLHFGRHKVIDVLMPGASGDTALTILNNPSVLSVTCVSPNGKELAALELRSQLVKKIKDPEKRISFLKGTLTWQESIEILKKIQSKLASKEYWNGHQADVIKGIVHLDKWFPLFQTYYEALEKGEEHEEACRQAFSSKKVIKHLGPEIVEQGLNEPFHITMSRVLTKNGLGIFKSVPKYLTLTNLELQKIRLINQNFIYYLQETERRFTMISLGNMTDYLSEHDLHYLIKLVSYKVKPKGRVIFRRLKSDFPLRDLVNEYFMILEIDRDFTDYTNLYQEVIVGCPRA